MADDAYLAAVTMLARRELSERQIRQRLARKAFAADDVDEAIGRLKAERTLDDARVAGAIARTETGIRKRGPLRVRQKLAAAGITGAAADAAIEEVTSQVDMDAMLEAALARRLGADAAIDDDRTMSRLYRQLTSQGFEQDRVLRLLRSRRSRGPGL
jgi:regulatory protein